MRRDCVICNVLFVISMRWTKIPGGITGNGCTLRSTTFSGIVTFSLKKHFHARFCYSYKDKDMISPEIRIPLTFRYLTQSCSFSFYTFSPHEFTLETNNLWKNNFLVEFHKSFVLNIDFPTRTNFCKNWNIIYSIMYKF